MEVIATLTFGLLVWIVLWALGTSGLDAFMVGFVVFLVAVAVQNVVPRITGPKSE